MTLKTRALIALLLAALVGGSLFAWSKAHHANDIIITKEDMQLLLQDQSPQVIARFASNPEARKKVAEQLQEELALAEEARAAGIADKPEIKQQLDLQRKGILAQSYAARKAKESGGANITPEELATDEEVNAYMNEPGRKVDIEKVVDAVKASGQPLPEGEELDELKKQVAQLMIVARKAEAEGLDKDRKVQLQITLQQAALLNRAFGKELQEKLKATPEEIAAYVKEHPDLDDAGAKAKAEDIVKQLRAGGDFAKLAAQYSADGSKDEGGDLGYFGRGRMVKEFEETAFNLQPGQVSEPVKTQFGYHIIKVEDRRTEAGEAGVPEEQVRARHILIPVGSLAAANPLAPPQTPEDRARAAVEQEKIKKFLEEVKKRHRVEVAEDFKIDAPPMQGMQPMPRGMMGAPPPAGRPMPADDPHAGHGHAPGEPHTDAAAPPAPKPRP